MDQFTPGQRWISATELEMGLGTVLASDFRTVTIVFLSTGETRTYAKQSAPLTRAAFGVGETIASHDEVQIKIESVAEQAGILTYTGRDPAGNLVELEEGQLSNFIQLNRPTERLFHGQIDQDKWFELRYRTLLNQDQIRHSEILGLVGCRTSLIPHQLYIAHEVANRYAPRVLLADEVGLGKTIEAGLILHHQLITERAKRILIVVPETLLHQWLVEMLRRFNLYFSIFDEARCEAVEESAEQENPFHTEQLVLCDLTFLVKHPNRFEQALQGEWDLLIVDEAHHLQWSPEEISDEYNIVEQLAIKTKGVLLLTATPEQLGKASHFARLRLLDPDRFPDYDAFVAEEQAYEPIAQVVDSLLNNQALSEPDLALLSGTLSEGDNQGLLEQVQQFSGDLSELTEPALLALQQAGEELVEHLLDRHGTGRVLFRNTRAAVKGFPERVVTGTGLALPAEYAQQIAAAIAAQDYTVAQLLSPELFYIEGRAGDAKQWLKIDPRIAWLGDKLLALKPHKVLVITSNSQTAFDLADVLKNQLGIHAGVFHEQMSIVERDRAAAYFAEQDYGAQVLVCSEIGSEGRNFQFAHHLVLFDLPLNPDLLEQRIGRLDRIGQTSTVEIHVPYLEGSAQAVLFRWYHEGLAAFEHTCPAGHTVFVQYEAQLMAALIDAQIDLEPLLQATQTSLAELNEALHKGRDRLLEYNSCRPKTANKLKQTALEFDETSDLLDYMEAIFDCFGVHSELHSADCYIVRPSEQMLARIPGLPDDGLTVTFNRDTALAYEDIDFLTWEHPLVNAAMDMVQSSELGNTSVTATKYAGVRAGTVLLECIYILEPASTAALQASRYLPATIIRVVLDEQGRDHNRNLSPEQIQQAQTLVDASTAKKVVRAKKRVLKELLERTEQVATEQVPEIRARSNQETQHTLMTEINRLKALRHVNPNVREDEINYFEDQLAALMQALASASFRLDALRVIVAT